MFSIPGIKKITVQTGYFFFVLSFSIFMVSAETLLKNGGFESGLDGWEHRGIIVKHNPHGGLKALQIDDTSASEDIYTSINEYIPINKNDSYTLSFWYRCLNDGQKILVTVSQFDSLDKFIPHKNLDIVLSGSNVWQNCNYTIRTFDSSCYTIKILLRPTTYDENGVTMGLAWFDDISFSKNEKIGDALTDGICCLYKKSGEALSIWGASGTQKIVEPFKPVSDSICTMVLSAACNEFESFQVIVKNPAGKTMLTGCFVSPLVHEENSQTQIDPSGITIREVKYVDITRITDMSCNAGWAPDPLPLLSLPLTIGDSLQRRSYTPLYVTIKIPDSAIWGNYKGKVTLQFDTNGTVDIPFSVKVRNFRLPSTPALRTSYGIDINTIDKYHNLSNDYDKRKLMFRKYLKTLADYRIAPTDILGDDQIPVSITDDSGNIVPMWDGGELDSVLGIMKVHDTDTKVNFSIGSSPIKIDRNNKYILSFKARLKRNGSFSVSVNQMTKKNAWIHRSNMDKLYTLKDSGWNVCIDTLEKFNSLTENIRLFVYATPWTETGEDTGCVEIDDITLKLLDQSGYLINETFSRKSNLSVVVKTDDKDFVSAAEYALKTLNFNSFKLSLEGFPNAFQNLISKPFIGGNFWGSPESNKITRDIVQKKIDYFSKSGWIDRAYTYWIDEPAVSVYDEVKKGMTVINDISNRKIKRLLTVLHDKEPLNGFADIWVPLLDNYDKCWADSRSLEGDEMWWYVCCVPRAPFTNNYIDHSGLSTRLRYWMAWENSIKGELYWSVNYYQSNTEKNDPWRTPASVNWVNSHDFWGNGDGRLLYPPQGWDTCQSAIITDPVPSMRLETIRDGIEDYEYFVILNKAYQQLLAKKWFSRSAMIFSDTVKSLLNVPSSITSSLVSYTNEIMELEKVRSRVADGITECSTRLNDTVDQKNNRPVEWVFRSNQNCTAVFRDTVPVISVLSDSCSEWCLESYYHDILKKDSCIVSAIVNNQNSADSISFKINYYDKYGKVVKHEPCSIVLSKSSGWDTIQIKTFIPDGVAKVNVAFTGSGRAEFNVAYLSFNSKTHEIFLPDFSHIEIPSMVNPRDVANYFQIPVKGESDNQSIRTGIKELFSDKRMFIRRSVIIILTVVAGVLLI
jgi:hypothetical protein